MTQAQRITNYINQFGSISPIEAFNDLGITKLATRIGEMRKRGVEIHKKKETTQNRFGESVEYMRYSFPKEG